MARGVARLDGRLCHVPPRRRHPRGAAGPHRRPALHHDLPARSGRGPEVLHGRDEAGRDRARLAPTLWAGTVGRRGPRATEASPDPGLGLHESRRPGREPGAGRGDREPRWPRPRGYVPRGHTAGASIWDGRDAFGKGRVLPADLVQTEGHPRRARRPLGAVRMKLRGPAGIVNSAAEGIVAVGAILAGIPMVDGIDVGGLENDDTVRIDGDRGTVELAGVRGRSVVSVVLRNRGRILLVRRSAAVGTF